MPVTLRKAIHSDIPVMVRIAAEGSEESAFHGVFDVQKAVEYLSNFLDNSDTVIMLAIDGDIVGGVMLAKSYEFWTQPFCYMVKFWVSKAGRRTSASRRLMRFMSAWAKRNDCLAVYATATGELTPREQRLFENLMKRAGFIDVGPTLKKRITDHG